METIDLDSSAENLCTLENDIQDYENFKTTENVNTSSASESVQEYPSDVNKLIANMSNVSEPVDRLSSELDKSCENSVQQNIKKSSLNNKEDSFQFKRCNLDIQEEFNKHSYVSKDVVEPSVPSSENVLEGEINYEKCTILGVAKTKDISKLETNSDSNPLTKSQERKRLKERFTISKKKLNLNSEKSISTYTKKRKTKQNRAISEKDLPDHIFELQTTSDVKRIRDSTMTQSGNNEDSSDILEKNSILVHMQQKSLENQNTILNDVQMPSSVNTLVRVQHKPIKKKGKLAKTRKRGRKNKNETKKKYKPNEQSIVDSDNDIDDIVLSKFKENIAHEENNSTISLTSEMIEQKNNLVNFQGEENKSEETKSTSVEEHTIIDDVKKVQNELNLGFDSVPQESEYTETFKKDCSNLSDSETSLLVEKKVKTPSKRPQRKKAKQRHYEMSSDEDPFANVELSDSDTGAKRKSKGYRYYSDEEYVPEKEKKYLSSDSSIELEDLDEENIRKKKRHKRKNDAGKRQDKANKVVDENSMEVKTIDGEGVDDDSDIERCLQSSVIKVGSLAKQVMLAEKQSLASIAIDKTQENSKGCSSTSSEFENFLANKKELKIKKVKENESNKMSIDIPILDQSKIKQTISTHSQTNILVTKTMFSQTSSPYDIKLKENMIMSQTQSKSACEFLTNVLESTTELGQLMCEKSSEFLKKKVNINHIQDASKLDNCVNKAFLLLKLAKENITTMEESLQKQYEQYLYDNNLICAFEIDKKITPTVPEQSNDSDCEIIEEPIVSNSCTMKKQMSKLNPKTVFLNKELSIKIAKKSPSKNICLNQNKDNLLFRGKHPAWISESVTVKKVRHM